MPDQIDQEDVADAATHKARRLLPPSLRDKWVVVPRYGLYQLLVVGALFGAAAALGIVRYLAEPKTPVWPIVACVVAVFVQAYLLDRYKGDRMAQEFLDKTSSE